MRRYLHSRKKGESQEQKEKENSLISVCRIDPARLQNCEYSAGTGEKGRSHALLKSQMGYLPSPSSSERGSKELLTKLSVDAPVDLLPGHCTDALGAVNKLDQVRPPDRSSCLTALDTSWAAARAAVAAATAATAATAAPRGTAVHTQSQDSSVCPTLLPMQVFTISSLFFVAWQAI